VQFLGKIFSATQTFGSEKCEFFILGFYSKQGTREAGAQRTSGT
jgi:hypothetical protein